MIKMIAIGFVGDYTVYVNIDKDEAIKRFNIENPDYTVELQNLDVQELEIEDVFYVYDITIPNKKK